MQHVVAPVVHSVEVELIGDVCVVTALGLHFEPAQRVTCNGVIFRDLERSRDYSRTQKGFWKLSFAAKPFPHAQGGLDNCVVVHAKHGVESERYTAPFRFVNRPEVLAVTKSGPTHPLNCNVAIEGRNFVHAPSVWVNGRAAINVSHSDARGVTAFVRPEMLIPAGESIYEASSDEDAADPRGLAAVDAPLAGGGMMAKTSGDKAQLMKLKAQQMARTGAGPMMSPGHGSSSPQIASRHASGMLSSLRLPPGSPSGGGGSGGGGGGAVRYTMRRIRRPESAWANVVVEVCGVLSEPLRCKLAWVVPATTTRAGGVDGTGNGGGSTLGTAAPPPRRKRRGRARRHQRAVGDLEGLSVSNTWRESTTASVSVLFFC
jgi:hypothetical protein